MGTYKTLTIKTFDYASIKAKNAVFVGFDFYKLKSHTHNNDAFFNKNQINIGYLCTYSFTKYLKETSKGAKEAREMQNQLRELTVCL